MPKFTRFTVVQLKIAVAGQMGEHSLSVLVELQAAQKTATAFVVVNHNAVPVLEMLLERRFEREYLVTKTALEVVRRGLVFENRMLFEPIKIG